APATSTPPTRRPASTPARRSPRRAIEVSGATATAPLPRQALYLAWRSVIRTARQPIVIVPPLVFPLFLLAINASGLDAATSIPGFPADSYLAFALASRSCRGHCSPPTRRARTSLRTS